MKKIFLNFKAKNLSLFLICFLSMAVIAFNSCSKEKKLDGTTWGGSYSGSESGGNINVDATLMFTGNSVNVVSKETYTEYGYTETYNNSSTGTFTCDKDRITLTVNGQTWTGTIGKGMSTMTLNIDGKSVTFTKRG